MTRDTKKFHLFLFLSTLAISMIEIFIQIYLYKSNFTFKSIILFYLLCSFFSLFISTILVRIGNNKTYKLYIIICSISFIITYYLLNSINLETSYLILLSFFHSLYLTAYWLVKRYYSIHILDKKASGTSSGFMTISTNIAVAFSALLGGLFLDNKGIFILSLISLIIMNISILPLLSIKLKKEKPPTLDDAFAVMKKIPKSNLINMFLYDSLFFIELLIPLYLYIELTKSYMFIGIINAFLILPGIIFILLFAKKMDKDKYSYYKLLTIVLGILFILKINIKVIIAVVIITIIEGYLKQMHEVAHNRNIYYYGKKFNISIYNYFIEIHTNISRYIIAFIILVFNLDLTKSLYFVIILFLIMSFFKFDDGRGGYK